MAYDPHFSSVSLLLHCDGSNGSSTFVDSGSAGNTVTASGNAQLSTVQSRFGGASALFDGSGDYLVAAGQAGAGTGDFTVEMWVYLRSYAQCTFWDSTPIGGVGHRGTSFVWYMVADGTVYVFTSGANILNTSAGAIPLNTWTHIALVRADGVTTLYIGGVSVGSTSFAFNDTAGGGVIGTFCDNTGFAPDGYFDEIRRTVGVARYTANFTVPTEAFVGVETLLPASLYRLGVETLSNDNAIGSLSLLGVETLSNDNAIGSLSLLGVETLTDFHKNAVIKRLGVEVLSEEVIAVVERLGVEILSKSSSQSGFTNQLESAQTTAADRRWPQGLPGPIVDNYSSELQDTLLRSAMDTGPGKVRRRFSAASAYVTANWRMTRAQLGDFHEWYVATLQHGSLTFLWPDPWAKPMWSQSGVNYPAAYMDPGHTHNGTPVTPNSNGVCPTHPWVVMWSGAPGIAKLYEIQHTWHTARFRKLNAYKPVGGTRALESNSAKGYASLALLWEVSAELEILP